MAYYVRKRVKGKLYLYLQTSWREGKKVRTSAKCLGPVNSSGGGMGGLDREEVKRRREYEKWYAEQMAVVEREALEFEEWQRATYGETAQERQHRERQELLDTLHVGIGLKMPDE